MDSPFIDLNWERLMSLKQIVEQHEKQYLQLKSVIQSNLFIIQIGLNI